MTNMLDEGVPWSARVAAGFGCLSPRGLATVAGWATVMALGSYAAGARSLHCFPSGFKGPAQGKLAGWVLANRYLTLGVSLNLPGNSLVGGGGGIALLCGMSRQFGWVRYLLTVCLAVSPIPIMMLTGLSHVDMAATAALACR